MPSNIKEEAKLPSVNDTIEPSLEYTYLYGDLKPLINDYNYVYQKSNLIENDNYTYLDLTADLTYDNIVDSSTFHNCFEKINIEEKEDYLNILLGGYFMCSYGEKTTLEFSGENIISTSLPQVKASTYQMDIDDKLNDYIKLSISTKPKTTTTKKSFSFLKIYTTIGIVFFIALTAFIFIFKKIKSANSF